METTENNLTLSKKFVQRQETISFSCRLLLLATGKVGNLRTEKLQCIRYHATGLTQTHNTNFQPGNLARHIFPRFLTKSMQTTH